MGKIVERVPTNDSKLVSYVRCQTVRNGCLPSCVNPATRTTPLQVPTLHWSLSRPDRHARLTRPQSEGMCVVCLGSLLAPMQWFPADTYAYVRRVQPPAASSISLSHLQGPYLQDNSDPRRWVHRPSTCTSAGTNPLLTGG